MRVVIQRVRSAKVTVAGEERSSIQEGLVVLWGIDISDTWTDADYCIRKVLNIKLWNENLVLEDESRQTGERQKPGSEIQGGKTWAQSVQNMDLELLVVSQFTLFGSVKAGNKPDFHKAMPAGKAEPFFNEIVEKMRQQYKSEKIQTGCFGHFMQLSLVNDGPVTIVIESPVKPASPAGPSKESKNTVSPKSTSGS